LVTNEFGLFAGGFVFALSSTVPLSYFHNKLIITHFNVLKYIKKIFKILIQCIFNIQ